MGVTPLEGFGEVMATPGNRPPDDSAADQMGGSIYKSRGIILAGLRPFSSARQPKALDSQKPGDNILGRTLLNMRGIVIHFFQQDILNLHPMVYWGLAAVWVLLLISAVISVRTLAIPVGAKVVWLLLIFLAPVIGLALYAIRCLIKSNWRALAPLFHSRKLNQQLPSAKVPGAPRRKA